MTATEILYRDIRNEVPTNIEVLTTPHLEGNDGNFTECVVTGEVLSPGISLEPVKVDVGSIEHASQSVDERSNYAGPGRQISGYLMNHLVYSKHISDADRNADINYEAARSEAQEVIMTGISFMLESQSVEKAVERVADNAKPARSNVWFGLAK